jgi:hypothetical protein
MAPPTSVSALRAMIFASPRFAPFLHDEDGHREGANEVGPPPGQVLPCQYAAPIEETARQFSRCAGRGPRLRGWLLTADSGRVTLQSIGAT